LSSSLVKRLQDIHVDFTAGAELVVGDVGLPVANGVGVDAVPEFGFAGAEFSVDLHPAKTTTSKKQMMCDFINACVLSRLL
jgi:hypothetical protein